MRRLVWIVAVLGVLWGLLWVLASDMLERSIASWVSERRAEGWQAEIGAREVTGFPGRFDLTLSDIALADPETGVAFAADNMRISALSYWPGDLAFVLPQTPVQLTTPEVPLLLSAPNAEAALRLHPGTALQLDQLTATSEPWQISLAGSTLLEALNLNAEVTQGTQAEAYDVALNADQLTPGSLMRSALSLPREWPLAFETFKADAAVTFDAPLDRFTLQDRRPQPRILLIRDITAQWGSLMLKIAGEIRIDPQGLPEGQLDVLVENWRDAFELAEKSTAIPANVLPQAEVMLNALANMGDDPTSLDLMLRFAGGNMFLGPIPLGPAPRLARH